jgi:hypothetical protein
VAAALAVGAGAFWLYCATLLPGFDFGDTGSFQTSVASPVIRARDAYPLYFELGRAFIWLTGTDPARALNLASAAQGASACVLAVLVATELSGSLFAAVAAGVLLAGSYTFWSQAIIAEVYSLHIAFVAGTLLLLLRWQRHPTTARAATFFAVYALGFGNHLSMILLAPAYVVFLLSASPRGWRAMFAPRIVGLAALCACLGAAQYLWDFQSVLSAPQPARGLGDAFARFWFDVTKSDWRETMVLTVPPSMFADRLRMYWFDLRQQFGPVIPLIAAAGMILLFFRDFRRGALLALVYLASVLFAYSYNVGDTHVFYLPSHLCVALAVAVAVAAVGRVTNPFGLTTAAAALVGCYGLVRVYQDYPALDRSHDTRPTSVMADLAAGLRDRRAVVLTDMQWQIENGRSYFANNVRPDLEYARMPDLLLYAPVIVGDNLAIGREVVATTRARQELVEAYGPLVSTDLDDRTRAGTLPDLVRGLTRGTRYVLCVLKPVREFTLDGAEVDEAISLLSGGAAGRMPPGQYGVVVGQAGEPPTLMEAANDPFTRSLDVSGVPTRVRMESWLAADTIRRMGFGHVIAARQHTLIVERGVSFVAFDDAGRVLRSAYRGNIFEPQSRYLIRIAHGIVGP